MSTRLTFAAVITLIVAWPILGVSAAHGQTLQGIPNPASSGGAQPGAGAAPTPQAAHGLANVLSLGSSLDAILKRQPLNDFEAYVHSQEPLWNEAVQVYGGHGGIHGYSANPYAGKSPGAALAMMRGDYMRLHPDALKAAASAGVSPNSAGGSSPGRAGVAAQVPQTAVVSDEISQQLAMRKYPALAQEGSPLNREFVTRAGLYRISSPQLFTDPNWPMKLAEECATAVATGNTVAK